MCVCVCVGKQLEKSTDTHARGGGKASVCGGSEGERERGFSPSSPRALLKFSFLWLSLAKIRNNCAGSHDAKGTKHTTHRQAAGHLRWWSREPGNTVRMRVISPRLSKCLTLGIKLNLIFNYRGWQRFGFGLAGTTAPHGGITKRLKKCSNWPRTGVSVGSPFGH